MTEAEKTEGLFASVVRRYRSGAVAAYVAAMACSLLAILSLAIYGVRFGADILAPYFLGMALVELALSISNIGLTQFVQKAVPGSECRGGSLFVRALGIRLVLTLAVGVLAGIALALAPIKVSMTNSVMLMVLLLSVVSGVTRLSADFLECAGGLVSAQVVRGAGGLLRVAGLVGIYAGGMTVSVELLIGLEILACLLSGAFATGFLYSRVWKRYESKLAISWSQLVAFGSNDWSYLLQSPGAIRLASSLFLGEAMVTLLALAQSVLGPVARYMPAVLLRGVWMSKASLACHTGRDELASVMRSAGRANGAFAVMLGPLALIGGTAYLMYATGASIPLALCLSILLVASALVASYRVLREIPLQVLGEGGLVAKASMTASIVGILFGFAGRSSVVCWAAVGLVSSVTWWLVVHATNKRAIARVQE